MEREMSGYQLVGNTINLLIMGIIIESVVSAVFSITAVKMVNRSLVVKTSREAITYGLCFLLLFFVKNLRLFANTGIAVPELIDYIITSLVTARFTMVVKQLFDRITGNE
jgi:hypothetical protein